MTEETTTEQLAEIEGQATEYTPPEGWRVVRFGESLQPGDVWVNEDGTEERPDILHWDASAVSGGRCIRRIEPQPVQVREGRWRTRNGLVKDVTAMPTDHEDFAAAYPWWDGVSTWRNDGRWLAGGSTMDLVEYLGPIEPQPQPQAEPVQVPDADEQIRLLQQANDSQAETIGRLQAAIDERVDIDTADQTRAELRARIFDLETINQAMEKAVNDAGKANNKLRTQAEEFRFEISYLQNLLGESRQRVTQLEELVGSLRTINVTQEKAFTAAGKENNALRNQLLAVKTELASVAADRQQLRVELDAAQQVPADSPELRQLRADLAEVGHDRDMYRHAHELLVNDVNATHERTKAMTVEAIAEWLEPIRLVDSAYLANATMQHLPQIMRSLTGLDSHAID